ncbi:hypothetical protein QA640_45015 (plasmid) [Bradyrhizobium sp. CB82]|uniref:hypothetical protein n=1 Tax=Bradyrhizobium sp. CB82 TaxID=3039159 RepID=UPI0024B07219|nr:hypothetical protein [Bradyrhizobium sp. CB82]WFU45951.1 hypothetical protein QA640_45015 [Bradyrhizobium sp. CB82]
MGKPIAILLSSAAFAALAATGAMPIVPLTAPTSDVEQVRWVCNEWGRCWHQRDYYRPYGYYRRYDDDDEWRERYRYRHSYGYYGPRWDHGWRRGREDDNEQ